MMLIVLQRSLVSTFFTSIYKLCANENEKEFAKKDFSDLLWVLSATRSTRNLGETCPGPDYPGPDPALV